MSENEIPPEADADVDAADGRDDDEALSWADDDFAQAAPAADAVADAPDADDAPDVVAATKKQVPAGVLIFYGFVIGWMALYAIGWGVIAVRNWAIDADQLTGIIYRTMLVLMVAAPPLWLVTSIVANRGKRLVWTSAWLLVGVLLLMPWPYFLMYR